MAPRRPDIVAYGTAAVLVCVLDQLAKAFMRVYLADGPVVLVPGVLDLKLVYNLGAAFGIGNGNAAAFAVVALVIVAVCTAYVVKARPRLALAVAAGCVAGGGVGNLIDRVASGRVTDFIMTTFIDFPVFNIADIAIVCGFIVALPLVWAQSPRTPEQEGVADEPR